MTQWLNDVQTWKDWEILDAELALEAKLSPPPPKNPILDFEQIIYDYIYIYIWLYTWVEITILWAN